MSAFEPEYIETMNVQLGYGHFSYELNTFLPSQSNMRLVHNASISDLTYLYNVQESCNLKKTLPLWHMS